LYPLGLFLSLIAAGLRQGSRAYTGAYEGGLGICWVVLSVRSNGAPQPGLLCALLEADTQSGAIRWAKCTAFSHRTTRRLLGCLSLEFFLPCVCKLRPRPFQFLHRRAAEIHSNRKADPAVQFPLPSIQPEPWLLRGKPRHPADPLG